MPSTSIRDIVRGAMHRGGAKKGTIAMAGRTAAAKKTDFAGATPASRGQTGQEHGGTQRLASPVDRRSHALQLTGAGQALLKRAKSLAAVHEANLLRRFGAANHARMMEALRGFDARR